MTYYEEHREEMLARSKEYYRKHREEYRAYFEIYYKDNREKLLEKQRLRTQQRGYTKRPPKPRTPKPPKVKPPKPQTLPPPPQCLDIIPAKPSKQPMMAIQTFLPGQGVLVTFD